MDWRITVFKIKGASPFLMNNPALTLVDEKESKIIKGGKKKYVDEEEAEIRTYRTEDGNLYIPSSHFIGSLIKAGTGDKVNKRALNTLIAATVRPSEEEIPLLDKKDNPITKYKIDKRRVVVQNAGILRCRPMITDWNCLLALDIDHEIMAEQVVLDTLKKAGSVVGVGDFRPAKKGWFGRFEAELYTGNKKGKK